MACGKPVIAVANGGPDDFVTGENGILISSSDAGELEQAFDRIVQQHDKYDPGQIRSTVEKKFGGQAIAGQLEHIYKEVRGQK